MKIKEWIKNYPLIKELVETKEVLWTNLKYESFDNASKKIDITIKDIMDAEARLKRFAPYLMEVFPQTQKTNGIIESPIVIIPHMKQKMETLFNINLPGELYLKCDHDLPISGSIKARGGIYEVLKHAEDLAINHHLLTLEDDYRVLSQPSFKTFFNDYSIAVGSTGNLGLSIGIMSAKLGFQVYVHMSKDAKQWKKDLLREKGVHVIEYDSDYSLAVMEGRKAAENNPNMYFIDDENSQTLFLGYAVSALRLKRQLDEKEIRVDENHPLFVYLPCGVGGGPGGVTYGLKAIFKDHVHCFFAEPTHSPCMLLGLMTGLHNKISVFDIGLDNKTYADGLAVGRASGFVGKTLQQLISGDYTVSDDMLFILLKEMVDTEGIRLEPSALAGIPGMIKLIKEQTGKDYLANNHLLGKMKHATHIAWATGGGMVPESIMREDYEKGRDLYDSLCENKGL